MASHKLKKIEFSLRGARFFTTFLEKIEKIDLLLVLYCLDGFPAWYLVPSDRGERFYQSLHGPSSGLAFGLRGGSFSVFLTKHFWGKKGFFSDRQMFFGGKGGLGINFVTSIS